jgi:hypothetical protein
MYKKEHSIPGRNWRIWKTSGQQHPREIPGRMSNLSPRLRHIRIRIRALERPPDKMHFFRMELYYQLPTATTFVKKPS